MHWSLCKKGIFLFCSFFFLVFNSHISVANCLQALCYTHTSTHTCVCVYVCQCTRVYYCLLLTLFLLLLLSLFLFMLSASVLLCLNTRTNESLFALFFLFFHFYICYYYNNVKSRVSGSRWVWPYLSAKEIIICCAHTDFAIYLPPCRRCLCSCSCSFLPIHNYILLVLFYYGAHTHAHIHTYIHAYIIMMQCCLWRAAHLCYVFQHCCRIWQMCTNMNTCKHGSVCMCVCVPS